MIQSICAIALGATFGALLRWLISMGLNPLLPQLPLGTLAVNWIGSLFMGLALAIFANWPDLGNQWKLMLVTGFLGSLTTFSTFSAEMAAMINNGRLWTCALAITLHVAGSIIMIFAGLWLFGQARHLMK